MEKQLTFDFLLRGFVIVIFLKNKYSTFLENNTDLSIKSPEVKHHSLTGAEF